MRIIRSMRISAETQRQTEKALGDLVASSVKAQQV